MTPAGLPAGWRLELDEGARRLDRGRVLLGGAPFRVLRLTGAGARWLDRAVGGEPLAEPAAGRALARRLVLGGLAHPVPPPDAGPPVTDVTVVVPVHDDAGGLARTLAGLGPVGSVMVVDDGSADPGAVLRAVAARPGVAVLRNEHALGPGAARDRGWRAATTGIIAFVDADVDLPGGWLQTLLGHLGDAGTGAVAPRVVGGPGRAPAWLAAYEGVRSPLDLGPRPGPVGPGRRVPYVPTAALVVRRSALDAVGGFDLGLRYGEDVDLCWRLLDGGWAVRYEPRVVATHPSRPTLRRWLGQRYRYGTSAAPLTGRHPKAVAPVRVSGWSALAWGAVTVGQPVVGAAIGVATIAALVPKLRGLDHPVWASIDIAGKGNLRAGRGVAEAARRPWWPLALALAAASRRSRPALVGAVVVPPLLDWRAGDRASGLDPARYLALRLLDDVAYGTGVWAGCLSARTLAALRPSFTGPLPRPAPLGP